MVATTGEGRAGAAGPVGGAVAAVDGALVPGRSATHRPVTTSPASRTTARTTASQRRRGRPVPVGRFGRRLPIPWGLGAPRDHPQRPHHAVRSGPGWVAVAGCPPAGWRRARAGAAAGQAAEGPLGAAWRASAPAHVRRRHGPVRPPAPRGGGPWTPPARRRW